MKIFSRKTKTTPDTTIADPTSLQPTDAAGFLKRGYAFYARGNYSAAEADFRQVLQQEEASYEAHYALGLVLKAQERKDEAVEAFQNVLQTLAQAEGDDSVRISMLSRLAKGQINQLTKGDWDLEKEIWKRVT